MADIYGRLNGKSDTVLEGEKRARADLGAKLYVQQRFGALAFVRGGFLVGNRIEEEEPVMVEQELEPAEQVIGRDDGEMGKKIQKKRKRVETDTIDDAETTAPTSAVAQGETAVEEKTAQKDGETKEERRHRKEERRKAKAAHKAEKALRRAAKGERRKRKEEKRLRRARDASTAGDGVTTDTSSAPASIQPPASPAPPPEQATPGVPTPPINNPFNNRNTVRQRFIRQKRMASMDPQALREILMLKA